MPLPLPPAVLLVDNGSLEPAATLALRTVAAKLALATQRDVRAVSLLHSSAVASELLGGKSATILEPTLRAMAETKEMDIVILPFFIGPSGALVNYIPERVRHLRKSFPDLRVRLSPCLVDATSPDDHRMAALLAERARDASAINKFFRPAVAVVDHGTPERPVNAVRELVTTQVRALLGGFARIVAACSMERRPDAAYDFNEPLLERVLNTPEFSTGEVVVARLFLQPGRHAGPGGDLEHIAHAAKARHPDLHIAFTEPLGSHPGMIPLLQERLAQGLNSAPIE